MSQKVVQIPDLAGPIGHLNRMVGQLGDSVSGATGDVGE